MKRVVGLLFVVMMAWMLLSELFLAPPPPTDTATDTPTDEDRASTPIKVAADDESDADSPAQESSAPRDSVPAESIGSAYLPHLDDGFGRHPRAELSGRVVWADGTPVEGVEVTVFIREGESGDDGYVVPDQSDAETDASGAFVVERAPAERMLGVQFRHQQGTGVLGIGKLRTGRALDIGDYQLSAAGIWAGRTLDLDDQPIPHFPIWAQAWRTGDLRIAFQSDEEGRFSVPLSAGIHEIGEDRRIYVPAEGVVEEDVRVHVDLIGYVSYVDGQPAEDARIKVLYKNNRHWSTLYSDERGRFLNWAVDEAGLPYPIDLEIEASGQTIESSLEDPPAVPLEFIVPRGAALTIRVHQPEDGPAVGGFIDAFLVLGEEAIELEQPLRKDLEVTLSHLPRGQHAELQLWAYGYKKIRTPVVLPRAEHETIDVYLEAAERQWYEVPIVVRSDSGEPIEGARVDSGWAGDGVTTDANGLGLLTLREEAGDGESEKSFRPTHVQLEIAATGFAPRSWRYAIIHEGGTRAEPLEISLEPESEVTVEVLEEGGRFAEGVEVAVVYEKDVNYPKIIVCAATHYEDRDDDYVFGSTSEYTVKARAVGPQPFRVPSVPVGTHKLWIRTPEGDEIKEDLEVLPGVRTHRQVVLPRAFTVEYEVENSTCPPQYVDLYVGKKRTKTHYFGRDLRFDADGRASVRLRYPGTYRVRISDPISDNDVQRLLDHEHHGEVFELSF